ncbi:acidic mammalian chitinase-like [Xenentodon cancila]
MMSTAASQQTFIQSTIRVLRTHGFDGLDLDLDQGYPGTGSRPPEEAKMFTLLCKELSEAYQSESKGTDARLMLSAVMATHPDVSDAGYEIYEMSTYLDFVSVKTFDLPHGQDGVTSHHSPLYSENNANMDYVVSYWMEQGLPPGRLLLGFPIHANCFTLSTAATGVGAPVSGSATPGPYTQQIGILSYYEVCSFLKGTTAQWIDSQKVPYAVKGNHWVGFDNQSSIDFKVAYLRSRQLGGAAVWTLDMDDFSGQFCEQGKYPLISHLKHRLREDWIPEGTTSCVDASMASSSPPPPPTPPAPITASSSTADPLLQTQTRWAVQEVR